MNLFERAVFYSKLAVILPLFYIESRKSSDEEIKKEVQMIFENFKYKNKEGAYSELERMAADFDPVFFERWVNIIEKQILQPQFSSIIIEGEENLKQKENEVIAFVSSHRSLYDIPLIGLALKNNNIRPPIYTAGSNLAKGPLKYGLKKLGAALLDREKLRERDLFEISLANSYFTFVNKKGKNTVIFPEATRSRTTAFDEINIMFIKPVFVAQEERQDLDYKLIFVTESYERVPEDSELIKNKQASGGKKSVWKNLADIIQLKNWVGNSFGNAYITFSKPLYVKDFGDKKYSEIRKELKEKAEYELKRDFKITPSILISYSLFEGNRNVKDSFNIYQGTGAKLRREGFNVYPASQEIYTAFLESKEGKRIIRNYKLQEYYASLIYQLKNEK